MTDLMRLEAHELAILRDLGDVPKAKDIDIAAQLAGGRARRGSRGRGEEAPATSDTDDSVNSPV